MRSLGSERFALAGRDRGSYTAFRTAMDHPDAITHLATLADPDAWYGNSPDAMGPEAFADYRAAIHDPATVHGMLEDDRAGLGIDREHDEADRRAGRRVRCPVRVLWSLRDDLELLHGDVLEVRRPWTTDLSGRGIDRGHRMAEEALEELAAELGRFFASGDAAE